MLLCLSSFGFLCVWHFYATTKGEIRWSGAVVAAVGDVKLCKEEIVVTKGELKCGVTVTWHRDPVPVRSGIQFRIDPEVVHRLRGSKAEVSCDLIFKSRFLENGSHSGGEMAELLWLTY